MTRRTFWRDARACAVWLLGLLLVALLLPQHHADAQRQAPTWIGPPAPPGINTPTTTLVAPYQLAAQAVTQWYVDPANSVSGGCASDTNATCTVNNCSTPGDGPCRTRTQIAARWTTWCPTIRANTTVTWLSGETGNSDPFIDCPIVQNGANFAEIGTPTTVATFTLGTVTAKNRATPQLLTSTGFTAGGLAVGQLVVNSTRANSRALIRGLAGGTATLTQPCAAPTFPTAEFYFCGEVDTWASGDSVTVSSLPAVNLKDVQPFGGDQLSGQTGGTVWIQDIHVPDRGGLSSSSSYLPVNCMNTSYCQMVEDVFDPLLITQFSYVTNCQSTDGASINNSLMLAGRTGFVVAASGNNFFDEDVIAESGVEVNTSATVGLLYLNTGAQISNVGGAGASLLATFGATYAIWGPGKVVATQGGGFFNDGGSTWASTLLVTGGLFLDGAITTGTKYSAGTFTDGTALTAVNLDTNSALFNPKTNSRYAISH